MNIIDGFTVVMDHEARRLHSRQRLRTGSLAFPSDGGRETGRRGLRCCLVSKFASLARHGRAG